MVRRRQGAGEVKSASGAMPEPSLLRVEAHPDVVALTIEVDGRRVRLDREFLSGTTRDGDPTLLHGYAITGHVAQGLTVDHSLVLAGAASAPSGRT
jgi:hypothetical protein